MNRRRPRRPSERVAFRQKCWTNPALLLVQKTEARAHAWGVSAVSLSLSVLNACLAALVLAGLLVRRRTAASLVLPVYLALLVVERPPMWFWPGTFYTWSYWLFTDLLEAALRFALALELLRLVLGRLPVSRKVASTVTLAILGAALLLTLLAPELVAGPPEWIYFQAAKWAWKATFAGGWLFAALLLLALWYGVPLDPLHRDVASGLVLWALLQAFSTDLAPLDLILGRQTLQRVVYTGVLLAWLRSAWSRDAPALLGPAAQRLLQPWRTA